MYLLRSAMLCLPNLNEEKRDTTVEFVTFNEAFKLLQITLTESFLDVFFANRLSKPARTYPSANSSLCRQQLQQLDYWKKHFPHDATWIVEFFISICVLSPGALSSDSLRNGIREIWSRLIRQTNWESPKNWILRMAGNMKNWEKLRRSIIQSASREKATWIASLLTIVWKSFLM